MRTLSFFLIFVAWLGGCKLPPLTLNSAYDSLRPSMDQRLQSTGVVRIRSTYSLPSGNFKSTCTGTLLHAGDQSFKDCVVLSAAHCFKNMPKGTEHRIEFLNDEGQADKVFSADSLHLHPSFTATEAVFTQEQSAVDAALVRFKCALPATVRSAHVLNQNQIPPAAQLLVANFAAPEGGETNAEASSPSWIDQVISEDQSTQTRLQQNRMRVQSLDFPLFDTIVQSKQKKEDTPQAGLIAMEESSGISMCDVDSGQPAFFDSGRELYLVATLSRTSTDCIKGVVQGTLISPLLNWMEEVLGAGVVSYTKKLEPMSVLKPAAAKEPVALAGKTLAQNATAAGAIVTKLPSHALTPTTPSQNTAPVPAPSPIPQRTPSPTPSPSPTPTQAPAHEPSALRKAHTQGKPSVPPIAPLSEEELSEEEAASSSPEKTPQTELAEDNNALEEVDESEPPVRAKDKKRTSSEKEKNVGVCKGSIWVVNSKSRVWGTVIRLVDKDLGLFTEENMKCDVPNESEICLKEKPLPAGNGNSRSVLMQNINLNGCEKFKAGQSIYFQLSDFTSR